MIRTDDVIEHCFKTMNDKDKLEFIEGYCNRSEKIVQDNNHSHNFYRARILKELFNLAGETAPAAIENETEIVEDFSPAEVKRLISVAHTRLKP